MNRRNKQTYLIIMDFAKSVDKVPHRRLLQKMNIMGLEDPPTSGSTSGSLSPLDIQ